MADAVTIDPNAIAAAVDQAKRPLEELCKKLDSIRQAADQSGKTVAEVGKDQSAVGKLRASLGSVDASLSNITDKAKGVAESFARVTKVVQAPLRALQGLDAALGRLAAPGLAVAKAASALKVPVEALQELRFAASEVDVDRAVVDAGLASLNKAIEAEGANGDNRFARAGIDLNAPGGAEGVLLQLADLLASIKDPTERAKKSIELLGNTDLLPLLSQGRAKIQADRARAPGAGAVISREQVTQAQRLESALRQLRATAGDIANVIRANLVPVILPLVEALASWVRANRELIVQNIEAFIGKVAAAVESVDWTAVAMQLGTVAEVIGQVVDLMGGWTSVSILLGSVLGAGLLASVIKFVGGLLGLGGTSGRLLLTSLRAVGKALIAVGRTLKSLLLPILLTFGRTLARLALLLLANPIVLVIAGIAAAIALAAFLIVRNWETISGFFQRLWGRIGEAFERGRRWVGSIVEEVRRRADALKERWRSITVFFGELWTDVKAIFDEQWAKLQPAIQRIIAAAETIKAPWNALTGFFDELWTRIKNTFKEKWASIGSIIDEVKEALRFFNFGGEVGEENGATGNGQRSSPFGLGPGLDGPFTGASFRRDLPRLSPILAGGLGGPGQLGWIRQIVEFRNAPPGTRVSNDSSPNVLLESDVGYSLPSQWA